MIAGAGGFQFFFGLPHSGDFRIGIDHTRYAVVVHHILYSQNMVNRHFTLTNRGVRQHGAPRYIAAGVNTGMGRLHMLIHLHAVAQQLDIQFVQSRLIEIRLTAYAYQNSSGLYQGGLAVLFDSHPLLGHRRYFRIQIEVHAPFQIFRTQHAARFLVHRPQNLGHHLHNAHLHPHTVEERGELHADNAAADDNQRLGELLALERFFGSPVIRIGQTGYRRDNRIGTGTHQQIGCFVGFTARHDAEHSVLLTRYHGFPLHYGDTIRADCHLHAARQFLYNFVFAVDYLSHVESRRIGNGYAVFGGSFHSIPQLGGIQQCLCWNTSFIQAHAANGFLLKQDGLQTAGSRSLGRCISGRPAADNGYIISHNVKVLS